MSLCLGCFSNSARTVDGISASTSKQIAKGNIKHLLLASCNPVGGAAWFDTINPYFAGNTAATAANAILTALTAPLYRNIVIAMPQLVSFDPARADDTETEGTCGSIIYSSAGVTITATNLITDCTIPTDVGLAESFDMELQANLINGSEYKKPIGIDCKGFIWMWFDTTDPTTNSTLMSFEPRIKQHSQVINGCEQITGWKATLKNSCNTGIWKRVIDINKLEADVITDFIELGLL